MLIYRFIIKGPEPHRKKKSKTELFTLKESYTSQ